ncbi:MAG: hypothetical protein K6F56_03910 [Oscillospiraceae bacterium]|nr:hypothetical protein [Oscillospiraceae bacterium]
MKRKWRVLAPLMLTALGALAAGVSVLLQKTEDGADAPAAQPAGAAKPVRDPATVSIGSYSFISGFQNAATVELSIPYDPAAESFSVVSEDYLSPSDDSHVALLYAEDYTLQIEYAAYYGGEGWQAHCAALREKHADLREVCFGENRGVLFLDGDVLRFELPVPEDDSSFVQITVQKTSAFDGAVTELVGHPALCEQLAGISFERS